MSVFRKGSEHSHKEKDELIITKNKIAYEEDLPTYYNEKLKWHIQKTL